MPPLRDTMSLVNGEQADLGVADHFDEGLVVQTFGSHIPDE